MKLRCISRRVMGNEVKIALLVNSFINKCLLRNTYVPGTDLDSSDGRVVKAVFNLVML